MSLAAGRLPNLDVYGGGYQISAVPKRPAFIIPSVPVLKREPPKGPQWIHEVKFDGWRGQLHKADSDGSR
jgi:ATP-dependent DNA ligase